MRGGWFFFLKNLVVFTSQQLHLWVKSLGFFSKKKNLIIIKNRIKEKESKPGPFQQLRNVFNFIFFAAPSSLLLLFLHPGPQKCVEIVERSRNTLNFLGHGAQHQLCCCKPLDFKYCLKNSSFPGQSRGSWWGIVALVEPLGPNCSVSSRVRGQGLTSGCEMGQNSIRKLLGWALRLFFFSTSLALLRFSGRKRWGEAPQWIFQRNLQFQKHKTCSASGISPSSGTAITSPSLNNVKTDLFFKTFSD